MFLVGFEPGPTQSVLYFDRRRLVVGSFRVKKKSDCAVFEVS